MILTSRFMNPGRVGRSLKGHHGSGSRWNGLRGLEEVAILSGLGSSSDDTATLTFDDSDGETFVAPGRSVVPAAPPGVLDSLAAGLKAGNPLSYVVLGVGVAGTVFAIRMLTGHKHHAVGSLYRRRKRSRKAHRR